MVKTDTNVFRLTADGERVEISLEEYQKLQREVKAKEDAKKEDLLKAHRAKLRQEQTSMVLSPS